MQCCVDGWREFNFEKDLTVVKAGAGGGGGCCKRHEISEGALDQCMLCYRHT